VEPSQVQSEPTIHAPIAQDIQLPIHATEDMDETSMDALIDALKSEDRDLRMTAVEKLGSLGLEAARAAPTLVGLWPATRSSSDRAEIAEALRNLEPYLKDSPEIYQKIKDILSEDGRQAAMRRRLKRR
jgi:HEAT repeat protein